MRFILLEMYSEDGNVMATSVDAAQILAGVVKGQCADWLRVSVEDIHVNSMIW
jgi:hypothetical protein